MRRNRRKLAAQLLDQQLCQAVDETLAKANHSAPSRSCQFPALQEPVNTLPHPTYFSSTPPELPLPNFSKFDLAAFPLFAFSSTTPPPVRMPTPFRTLPKWCPKIPSLTLGDVWRDCLPTFHDLSYLPEPIEVAGVSPGAAREPCKDLQVWRPIGAGYGRDQSRFFPPRTLLTSEELGNERDKRVTVRLPPRVACRLHRSDNSVDVTPTMTVSKPNISHAITMTSTEVSSTTSLPSHLPHLTQTCFEKDRLEPVLPTISQPGDANFNETAATTFDDTLATSQTSVAASDPRDSCPDVSEQIMNDDQQRHNPSDRLPLHYTAEQSPYELDGLETEIPYVHANSLTGYSNEQDVLDTLPGYEERQTLADFGVGLPIMISGENHDLVGLNELVVDHDIMSPTYATMAAGVALPISPPATLPATPPLHPFIEMASILPIDCIVEAEHILSDAHYCSEQALFCQTPLSLAQNSETLHEVTTSSSINIADFLKMGHAKQCWCGHCADELNESPHNGANASISSSTTLADRDRAADDYDDLAISLLLHPSESESETEPNDPEPLSFSEASPDPKRYEQANLEPVENNDWLLFLPAATKSTEKQIPSASTMYVPSSPILHRQLQLTTPAPSAVVTASKPSANEMSEDYIAVAAPSAVAGGPVATNLGWHDMYPRRPSSIWRAELAACESGRMGCGVAGKGSWTWGRESEEEWWDWAVEEEC